MENRFNLVDEPWIPVVDFGRVSLRQLFSNDQYRRLSGNPVQKIALLKLLLAIAQASGTPKDDAEWQSLGSQGMANRCLEYLQHWHGRFWLYGEHPFLQMPGIATAAVQRFGAVSPEIATGNTTLLNQSQKEQPLDDPDKALLLVCLAGFALAGKKTDNSVVLTPGYAGKRNDKGKPSSGRAGPSLEYLGLLHSLFTGETLLETLWFNLLTEADLTGFDYYAEGVGTAVWERMPQGENCEVAQALKRSLQGRLVPLCRFCLLNDEGMHYSEGIQHASYREFVVDPTVSVDLSKKKKNPQVLWANPEKRPWREVTALLGFLQTGNPDTFRTLQLSATLPRIRRHASRFALWSGGLRVSSNAGEQYASGTDDYVESEISLCSSDLDSTGFDRLKLELSKLDALASKTLYGSVCAYFNKMKMDGSALAKQATHLFWQLCERDFQQLVYLSFGDGEDLPSLRLRYAAHLRDAFDRFCPCETARQMQSWAAHRPNASKYLAQGS